MFTTYGICQNVLNPRSEYNPQIHFVSGSIAGAVGCIVTMPLDVCKTLLNTQEAGVLRKIGQSEVSGLLAAARVVRRVTGLSGFFQGLTARVLYQAPSTAVAWSVYEFFKFWLKEEQQKSSGGGDGGAKYDTLEVLAATSRPVVAAKTAE